MKLLLCITIASGMVLPALAQTKSIPGEPPPSTIPGKPAADENKGDRADKAETDKDKEHGAAPAPANETEFVQKAAAKGMAEVKLAQLAVKKAEGEKVKEIAQTLVKDHAAANEALKEAARTARITINEAADPKMEEKYEQFNKLEGTSFDTAFIDHMDRSHQKGIAFYEAGLKVAKTEAVKGFIEKTLPVLRRHHEQIKTLQPAVRDPGTPNPEGNPEAKAQLEQPRR